MQMSGKSLPLGWYNVEEDAAAARDMVAKVLGFHLNFEIPRKITGQRSETADQRVADAIEEAKAFMLGNTMTWTFWTYATTT